MPESLQDSWQWVGQGCPRSASGVGLSLYSLSVPILYGPIISV